MWLCPAQTATASIERKRKREGREADSDLVTDCRGEYLIRGSDFDSVHHGRPLMAGIRSRQSESAARCVSQDGWHRARHRDKRMGKGTKRRLELKSCCDHFHDEATEGKEIG